MWTKRTTERAEGNSTRLRYQIKWLGARLTVECLDYSYIATAIAVTRATFKIYTHMLSSSTTHALVLCDVAGDRPTPFYYRSFNPSIVCIYHNTRTADLSCNSGSRISQ